MGLRWLAPPMARHMSAALRGSTAANSGGGSTKRLVQELRRVLKTGDSRSVASKFAESVSAGAKLDDVVMLSVVERTHETTEWSNMLADGQMRRSEPLHRARIVHAGRSQRPDELVLAVKALCENGITPAPATVRAIADAVEVAFGARQVPGAALGGGKVAGDVDANVPAAEPDLVEAAAADPEPSGAVRELSPSKAQERDEAQVDNGALDMSTRAQMRRKCQRFLSEVDKTKLSLKEILDWKSVLYADIFAEVFAERVGSSQQEPLSERAWQVGLRIVDEGHSEGDSKALELVELKANVTGTIDRWECDFVLDAAAVKGNLPHAYRILAVMSRCNLAVHETTMVKLFKVCERARNAWALHMMVAAVGDQEEYRALYASALLRATAACEGVSAARSQAVQEMKKFASNTHGGEVLRAMMSFEPPEVAVQLFDSFRNSCAVNGDCYRDYIFALARSGNTERVDEAAGRYAKLLDKGIIRAQTGNVSNAVLFAKMDDAKFVTENSLNLLRRLDEYKDAETRAIILMSLFVNKSQDELTRSMSALARPQFKSSAQRLLPEVAKLDKAHGFIVTLAQFHQHWPRSFLWQCSAYRFITWPYPMNKGYAAFARYIYGRSPWRLRSQLMATMVGSIGVDKGFKDADEWAQMFVHAGAGSLEQGDDEADDISAQQSDEALSMDEEAEDGSVDTDSRPSEQNRQGQLEFSEEVLHDIFQALVDRRYYTDAVSLARNISKVQLSPRHLVGIANGLLDLYPADRDISCAVNVCTGRSAIVDVLLFRKLVENSKFAGAIELAVGQSTLRGEMQAVLVSKFLEERSAEEAASLALELFEASDDVNAGAAGWCMERIESAVPQDGSGSPSKSLQKLRKLASSTRGPTTKSTYLKSWNSARRSHHKAEYGEFAEAFQHHLNTSLEVDRDDVELVVARAAQEGDVKLASSALQRMILLGTPPTKKTLQGAKNASVYAKEGEALWYTVEALEGQR